MLSPCVFESRESGYNNVQDKCKPVDFTCGAISMACVRTLVPKAHCTVSATCRTTGFGACFQGYVKFSVLCFRNHCSRHSPEHLGHTAPTTAPVQTILEDCSDSEGNQYKLTSRRQKFVMLSPRVRSSASKIHHKVDRGYPPGDSSLQCEYGSCVCTRKRS